MRNAHCNSCARPATEHQRARPNFRQSLATVAAIQYTDRPTSRERNAISIAILPADGTALPKGRIGDFGTSPIYGQLSDKHWLP
jgi:hypothetical protein